MQRTIRVLIALSNAEEAAIVDTVLDEHGTTRLFATDLQSVEQSLSDVDVILTDTEFASGSFADWMSLWPVPTVLVVDPSFDPAALSDHLLDESSAFIVRDPGKGWIRYIPMLVRKTAAVRESLDRQNTTIIRTESSYMNLLRLIPDIVYVLDGDGYFVYVNDAIEQLGWKPSELLGKHFAEIVHPEDIPEVSKSFVLQRYVGSKTGPDGAPKLFDERRTGERMTKGLDVRLRHRTEGEWTKANIDSWGEVACQGVNLPEFQGRGAGTVGLIHDVSERREAERRLAMELDARDLLIKETHHRVKNNLQVVSSLLSLESDCVEDENAKVVFGECQTQVQSMALVHEQVYRGSTMDGVEAHGYFARLAEYLAGVHDARAKGILILVETGDIVLPIDTTMPLSIITTELVANAFKHGYPAGRKGRIVISLSEDDGFYEYKVSDDGVGFAATESVEGVKGKSRGIGMDLIEALTGQLGGTMERSESEGATVSMRFPVKTVD